MCISIFILGHLWGAGNLGAGEKERPVATCGKLISKAEWVSTGYCGILIGYMAEGYYLDRLYWQLFKDAYHS